MSKESFLHQLDTHFVKAGGLLDFSPSPETRRTKFTANYSAVLALCQEVIAHFPTRVQPKGSPSFQTTMTNLGFSMDDAKARSALSSVSQGAGKLMAFTSAQYVIPIFNQELVPEKEGYTTTDWAFQLHLNAGDRFRLGHLELPRDFATMASDPATKLRAALALYGAGVFLHDIDTKYGDITRVIDVPQAQLVQTVMDSLGFAYQNQALYASIHESFLAGLPK